MTIVRKSVIVPHTCATMFRLVERCEEYPQFLPWCAGAEVFERTQDSMRARIDIDYHGVKTHIATFNRREEPTHLTLELLDGPFESFNGDWRFAPLGDSGCRIELVVDYTFAHRLMETVVKPVFGHIVETLVERFVERADRLAAGAA
jgi:Oligoketide cyclase/lipid transport protein